MSSFGPGAGKVDTGAANCSLRNVWKPTACRCDNESGVTPQVDCSRNRPAALALRVFGAFPTSNANALETKAPGAGLVTVIWTVPSVGALPVAVTSFAETKVVGSGVPPKLTTAPLTNLLPVTTIVKLPTGIAVGKTETTTGAGFTNVTAQFDVAVVSSALTAITVSALGLGNLAGAE